MPAVLSEPCEGLGYTPKPGTEMEAAVIKMRAFLRLCNDDKLEGAALWPGAAQESLGGTD